MKVVSSEEYVVQRSLTCTQMSVINLSISRAD